MQAFKVKAYTVEDQPLDLGVHTCEDGGVDALSDRLRALLKHHRPRLRSMMFTEVQAPDDPYVDRAARLGIPARRTCFGRDDVIVLRLPNGALDAMDSLEMYDQRQGSMRDHERTDSLGKVHRFSQIRTRQGFVAVQHLGDDEGLLLIKRTMAEDVFPDPLDGMPEALRATVLAAEDSDSMAG